MSHKTSRFILIQFVHVNGCVSLFAKVDPLELDDVRPFFTRTGLRFHTNNRDHITLTY